MKYNFPTNDIEEFMYYATLFAGAEYSPKLQLYHYTNLSNRGLILREDCVDLRFTRADCFKDTKEAKHVISIFEKTCDDCLENGIIDERFYSVIRSCSQSAGPLLDLQRKHYVFCLSSNGRSTYLTRNYACRNGDQGVIIGLHGLSIENLQWERTTDGEKPVEGIVLFDVMYDGEKLQEEFSELIGRLYEMREQDTRGYEVTRRTLVMQLMIYGLAYKDPSFSLEEETRIVVDLSKLTLKKEDYYIDGPNYMHILLNKNCFYDEVIVDV